MNKFANWWDDTITVYNKFEDKTTDIVTWYKTVINKCFWKNTENLVASGNTIVEANSIICRIPKNTKYITHSQWINLSDSEKSNKFTLSVGDIIVKGKVSDIIDEYQKDKHSTDLIEKYKENKECMIINNVLENIDNRGLEHYKVNGK